MVHRALILWRQGYWQGWANKTARHLGASRSARSCYFADHLFTLRRRRQCFEHVRAFHYGRRAFNPRTPQTCFWAHNFYTRGAGFASAGGHARIPVRAFGSTTFNKLNCIGDRQGPRPLWVGSRPLIAAATPKSPLLALEKLWQQKARTFSTGASSWSALSASTPSVSTPAATNNFDYYFASPRSETSEVSSLPESSDAAFGGSSYVDFDITPTFTIARATDLTEETVASLQRDIEAYTCEVQRILEDIKRVAASLGELPISIEQNNTTIRVHFPNADADKVRQLLTDVEVSRGAVRENVVYSDSEDLFDGLSSVSSSLGSYNSDVWGFDSTSLISSDLPTPSLTRGSSPSLASFESTSSQWRHCAI
ncbi:hypothetical protein TRVA0_005S00298 [Trichomonascus vanleenenianus]|uniref:Spg5p n=1 Tax=Trichomonascus vanleenenianus TaxID=2268995 RepID=UPI003ECAD4D6